MKRRDNEKEKGRKKIKEKKLLRKQRSNAKMKKYWKHCVNFKEKIVTLSQMNIFPFRKPTLQVNTNPIWSRFLYSLLSRYLHEDQAYSMSISYNEYLSECECLLKISYDLNYYIVWSRTFICCECIGNMRIWVILSHNLGKMNWSCKYLRMFEISFETIGVTQSWPYICL